jgi:hypothetical protein
VPDRQASLPPGAGRVHASGAYPVGDCVGDVVAGFDVGGWVGAVVAVAVAVAVVGVGAAVVGAVVGEVFAVAAGEDAVVGDDFGVPPVVAAACVLGV